MTKNTLRLMTKAQFARHRGVTQPAVTRWVKRGDIHLDAVTGLVDVEISDRRLNDRPERFRGGWTSPRV
jgi:ABC-type phosphonate transport system ATPase subunit